jgi:hypothetical protein
MILPWRGKAAAYAAIAAMIPKIYLAYKLWFWVEFLAQIMAMVIFVYFWRAVYAETTLIAGLTLQQTLNYILLAQVLLPILQNALIFQLGYLIREGQVGVELLRPLDFQLRHYVENLAAMLFPCSSSFRCWSLPGRFLGCSCPAAHWFGGPSSCLCCWDMPSCSSSTTFSAAWPFTAPKCGAWRSCAKGWRPSSAAL